MRLYEPFNHEASGIEIDVVRCAWPSHFVSTVRSSWKRTGYDGLSEVQIVPTPLQYRVSNALVIEAL